MKKLLSSLFLFCAALTARADTFSLFSPADGILLGDSTTYITTSADSGDVITLWSGTCNASSFLRGDGTCASVITAPAGSDTQVQYNNAGAFGASASFTWNNGSSLLTATNIAGSGAGITALNATNISSGTLNNSRLPSTINVATDVQVGGVSLCRDDGTNCPGGGSLAAAGLNTQIQYNNSGNFGASSALTFDPVSFAPEVWLALNGGTSTDNQIVIRADDTSNVSQVNIASLGQGSFNVDAGTESSITLNAPNPGATASLFVNSDEASVNVDGTGTSILSAITNGGDSQFLFEGIGSDVLFQVLSNNTVQMDIGSVTEYFRVSTDVGSGNTLAELVGTSFADFTVNGDSVCLEDGTNCPGGGSIAAAGSNTQVQYNNAGNFGASATFTFNSGTNTLTVTNVAGAGSGLTALNATQLTSGTVPDARFPATLPAVSGANLTNLNATNISSGTLADGRLSSNVPLKNASNTFTAAQTISGVGDGFRLVAPAATSARFAVAGNAGTPYTNSFDMIQDSAGVGYLLNRANAGLEVWTNNVARGTISAAGNWTINAPSSGNALTVNTTTSTYGIRVLGDMSSEYGMVLESTAGSTGRVGLQFNRTGGTAKSWAIGNNTIGGTDNSFDIRDITRGATPFNISTAGNVTIAAPSSGAALGVSGLTATNTQAWTSTGAGAQVGFGWGVGITGGAWNLYTNSTDPITIGTAGAAQTILATNSAERLNISSAGNVTINAPSSGITQTLNAVNQGVALSASDATVNYRVQFGASSAETGTFSAHSLNLVTNSTTKVTIGSGGGVQFGSPTGGDQGAGTLNTAGGIYTNGALISPIKMVSGYCSSSGTPGCANLVGYGGASVAYSSSGGTGQITVTFSGFTDPGSGLGPQCVATSTRGVASPSFVEFTSSSYTVGNFVTRNTTTGTAENQSFRFICTGT